MTGTGQTKRLIGARAILFVNYQIKDSRFIIFFARECGVPAVGVRVVDCWQWRSGHYNHQSFFPRSPPPFLIEGVRRCRRWASAPGADRLVLLLRIQVLASFKWSGFNLPAKARLRTVSTLKPRGGGRQLAHWESKRLYLWNQMSDLPQTRLEI